jgi:YD repeat-containing protein
VTSLAYDLRGRKTSRVDPDMGTWQYRYNTFGELIWQTDAKGQITTMAHDVLGRLVTWFAGLCDRTECRYSRILFDHA